MANEKGEEFLKNGTLLVKEDKKFPLRGFVWVEKYAALLGSPPQLLIFKTLKDYQKRSAPKRYPLEKGLTSIKDFTKFDSKDLEGAPEKDAVFQVTFPDKDTFIFCAPNKSDAETWVDGIRVVMEGRKDLDKETFEIEEGLRKAGHLLASDELEFADQDIVGAGASGAVRKGMFQKVTPVAVKTLKNLPEFTDQSELTQFFNEIATLSNLRHGNIVQMYGFCRKDNYLCLVTEYVKGGNLSQCLAAKDLCILDLPLAIEICCNICRAMVFLHSKGIIHRDLKPANILIESWEEGKIKVCDFGISRVTKHKPSSQNNNSQEKTDENVGSPQYAAPELTGVHDNKVDVFSFAIILWEIAYREMPWPEVKFGWQFSERYGKGERPPLKDSPFRDLIEKCWKADPKERPSFQQIYQDLEQIRTVFCKENGSPSMNGNKPSLNRVNSARPSTGTMIQGASAGGIQVSNNNGTYSQMQMGVGFKGVGKQVFPPQLPHTMSGTNINGMTPYKMNGQPNGPSYPKFTLNTNPSSGEYSTKMTPMKHTGSNGSIPTSPTNGVAQTAGYSHNGVGPSSSTNSTPVSSSNNLNTVPPIPLSKQNTTEQAITRIFSQKNSEGWDQFADVFGRQLNASQTQVFRLKWLFEKNGLVEKSTWDMFLNWFTPLPVFESMYQTGPIDSTEIDGFDIDLILSICSPNWFHGFMSSVDASAALKGKPDGTFLMRFSTNIKNYALSVSYKGVVGHWRIQCEKQSKQPPIFKIDSREYKSLVDIVHTHSQGREPLIIKATKDVGNPQCYLGNPLSRVSQDSLESHYGTLNN